VILAERSALEEKTAKRVLRSDRPFTSPLKGFAFTATDLYYEIG